MKKLIDLNDEMMPKYIELARNKGISLNRLIGLLLARELKEKRTERHILDDIQNNLDELRAKIIT